MKTLSREELLAVAYRYFPRGILHVGPEYRKTPEFQRFSAVWERIQEEADGKWVSCVGALRQRFQGVGRVRNLALPYEGGGLRMAVFLDGGSPDYGRFVEPVTIDVLVISVCVLAPVYLIHGLQISVTGGRASPFPRTLFETFTDDMRKCAPVAAQEVERIYGYSSVRMEDALTVVPEIAYDSHGFGETLLMHLLFGSDPAHVF